jgi:hypothetical protein
MPGPEEGDELEEAAAGWPPEGHHHQEHLSGTLSCSSRTAILHKYLFKKFTTNFLNNQAEKYVQEISSANFLEVSNFMFA